VRVAGDGAQDGQPLCGDVETVLSQQRGEAAGHAWTLPAIFRM